ncbi:tyrosinase family protein [Rhodococcus kronopolitis]|uniref:Tyrosinase family protein n=1 Tax=Rhodococcus kronopolitis TaxID=1460226 RepID=A0ABV9FV84_9NOCA
MISSVLFQGDVVLTAIAGGRDRMSSARNASGDAVGKLQTALRNWDPHCLPAPNAAPTYCAHTAAAVRRFKVTMLGEPEASATDVTGPEIVLHLDRLQATAEGRTTGPLPRIRRNVWRLSHDAAWDPTLLAYARAVRTMQSRPPHDPTSWAFQAGLRSRYADATAADRGRGNWLFLPWHRMHLHYFEAIVRDAVAADGGPADFALPYWNYGNPAPQNTLPHPFRDPRLLLPGGAPNPLALPAPLRSAEVMAGAPLSLGITSTSTAMWRPSFSDPTGTGFSGQLENAPHGCVQVAVGGDRAGSLMSSSARCALDPVYWLHHANLDRLWVQWLERHANPTDEFWLGTEFEFYDAAGAPVRCRVADVLDHVDQLDYRYDDQPQPSAPSPRPVPVTPTPVLAAATGPVEVTARVTTRLVVAESDRAAVAHAPEAAAAAGFGAVLLTVDELAAECPPGVVYRVYLNVPDPTADALPDHHLAGTFAAFGLDAQPAPGMSAGGVGVTFDVTALVQALAAAGAWDPQPLAVTVQAVLPTTGTQARIAECGRPTATAQPLQIGRLALFVC